MIAMPGIDIKPDAQGKVRDLYDLGDKLLLVASDRISAFDYILQDEIPYKGQVLTQLSCFWFDIKQLAILEAKEPLLSKSSDTFSIDLSAKNSILISS